MARNSAPVQEKTVDPELLAAALAKAVVAGDIVNFRLLFAPFSPGREDSSERFETAKYRYLLPEDDMAAGPRYEAALAAVRQDEVWSHIQKELEAQRPPQLPSTLLLPLADNAVRLGKYSSAAQAYELLRIRRRMQQLFLDQGDAALDQGDYVSGAAAYEIAAGLSYDYAAFPEPLPLVPNYQTEALKLHGVYPTRPEDCPAWLDADAHTRLAIEYLLVDSEVAGRVCVRPVDTRVRFLQEFVRRVDPQWDAFVGRYREAVVLTQSLRDYLKRHGLGQERPGETLRDEIQEQQFEDPMLIPARLLGRTIEDGTWWQYLKELAYAHPAAPLFVARQLVGDQETIIPPLRTSEGLATTLGLVALGSENEN